VPGSPAAPGPRNDRRKRRNDTAGGNSSICAIDGMLLPKDRRRCNRPETAIIAVPRPASARARANPGASVSPSRPTAAAAAPSGPDCRRLVLGAAIGFDVAQVRVFVESLRAHYAGDVLLLIRWPGLRVARYLKGRGVD